jgi:hypothetical protein
MRGGVDSYILLNHTDLEDLDILNGIVKENIELTKSSKMPLI